MVLLVVSAEAVVDVKGDAAIEAVINHVPIPFGQVFWGHFVGADDSH
jgi:hypothetical protein